MKILITGAAGFVGSKMVEYFRQADSSVELVGIDNLSRKGSETNIGKLQSLNCDFYKGDISNREDIEQLPKVDWIIDCAANPSVLAGLENDTLRLINDNLTGTFHVLEKCKKDKAGFIMLSTSRVYSINSLNSIPLVNNKSSFIINDKQALPYGCSADGINEKFNTQSPISLYGATKLASEIMALEYHYSFGFPVWINRCGVIAGAGQFGKIDQGIFSYWIYQYLLNRPLAFIGYEGSGFQARDMLHPFDVFRMIQMQMYKPVSNAEKTINLGGGKENTYSLLELDAFCKKNILSGKEIMQDPINRKFDIPLYVTDFTLAKKVWNWEPTISAETILNEILAFGSNQLERIKSYS